MPTIHDNFQFAAAAWEINERLIYHSRDDGGMLRGLKYDKEGTFKVEGEDDLPLCQPYSLNLAESISPGAPRTNDISKLASPVAGTQTLVYRVAVRRKDGWFRRDPTDSTQAKGLLEWLALIQDAIETTRDGEDEVDCSLDGALMKPPTFRIQETETTQKAFHCYLEVELDIKHHCRGERGFELPEPA